MLLRQMTEDSRSRAHGDRAQLMATPGPENYKELLLFLATAGVIVPLFGRLKLSPIFGFLAAGIVLGPFGLGALAKDVSWLSAVSITDVGQIAPIAEFGVAFLLFMIALELSWNRLIELEFSCASGPLS